MFVFLVIVSLISGYYYIRPVKLFFFHSAKKPKFLVEIPYISALLFVLLFFFNLLFDSWITNLKSILG